MKYAITSLLLLIFSHSYSQCEIEELVDDNDGAKIYAAGWERLFTIAGRNNNGDYGEGGMVVYGRLLSREKDDWVLEIFTRVVRLDNVIPRSLEIKTMLGEKVLLKAEESYSHGEDRIYIYFINKQELSLLAKELYSISLRDTRTNMSKTSKFDYNRILGEQINCINKY